MWLLWRENEITFSGHCSRSDGGCYRLWRKEASSCASAAERNKMQVNNRVTCKQHATTMRHIDKLVVPVQPGAHNKTTCLRCPPPGPWWPWCPAPTPAGWAWWRTWGRLWRGGSVGEKHKQVIKTYEWQQLEHLWDYKKYWKGRTYFNHKSELTAADMTQKLTESVILQSHKVYALCLRTNWARLANTGAVTKTVFVTSQQSLHKCSAN